MKTNEELQHDVMTELKWDLSLTSLASQIGVTAKDGVVTLSGLVDSYSKKRAAERAAQRVQGVKVVASDIVVKIGSLWAKTDTEIAEAVKNALRWHSLVDEDRIEAKVDNGWVVLEGKADFPYQKTSAEECVENLVGVKGVTNRIVLNVKPIDVKELKNHIAAAYHRSATVDAASIRAEVNGARVTLYGTVRSWAEKEEAEKVAYRSPGVLVVDNRIDIDTEIYA
jgi:osmotically-inducible protein OsmY